MSALRAIPHPHGVPPHRQLEAPFTTFATMLQSNLRRLEELQIKLPPWLYLATPYERKDQSKLSALERERFLCALDTLIQNGEYGKLVDIHAEMHMQHTNERLLPWHRIFLLQLEIGLRAIHPDVSIPFCPVQRLLKIHESVVSPNAILKFLARDDLSWLLQKGRQNLKWLLLHSDRQPVLAQF